MPQSYIIRLATPADAPLLPAVELAAASLYLTQLEVTGLTAEILAEPNSAEDFAMAQQADMLWVAADADDNPIGFALLAGIDQWLHLDELDVLPEYGRRGIGTALVQRVCQLAREGWLPRRNLGHFPRCGLECSFLPAFGLPGCSSSGANTRAASSGGLGKGGGIAH
jgi:GNAT superfamily N-acetyltransferase